VSFNSDEISPPQLIKALRSHDLLPAIIFVPSRRKCDEAATEVALDRSFQADAGKQDARQQMYDDFLPEYPEIKRHKHRKIMLSAGIASHHAGHIPAWKLLIEKMMSAGLLNAIFATSTVAAGVDFPARTVVVANADTRGNDGWRPLEASELQQMTGRAGRRGRDNVGFIVLAPGRFQNPPKIAELLASPPDPLESKFRATYTSLLNLLDAFGDFARVREIAEKSFAFRNTARKIARLEKKIESRTANLRKILEEGELGLTVGDAIAFERLTAARNRLQEKLPVTRAEMRQQWLKKNVTEGRIVSKGRSGRQFFIVLDVFGDNVNVMRDDGRGATVSLSYIKRIYAKKYPLSAQSVETAFNDIYEGRNPVIKEPKLQTTRDDADDAVAVINAAIDKLLPDGLSEDKERLAQQLLWETWSDAEFIQKTRRDIENLRSDIWQPFENRAKVLDHFGYLDFNAQKVSAQGKWLADLRLDRPLMVGEALKKGLFEKLDTKRIAGLMAALAADAEREYGKLHLSDKLLGVLNQLDKIIFEVAEIEWDFGVEVYDEINDSAAAAAEAWASGIGWTDLVRETNAEEGDLVRLLSRTGEALMQIAHIHDSNPAAAEIARETAETILREPIR
jgi:ATP-dependent RNA helicase HelY